MISLVDRHTYIVFKSMLIPRHGSELLVPRLQLVRYDAVFGMQPYLTSPEGQAEVPYDMGYKRATICYEIGGAKCSPRLR